MARHWRESIKTGVLARALGVLYKTTERERLFVEGLLSLLAPHGSLIIMEPALRETSRGLLQVRDALLAKQGVVGVAVGRALP